MIHFINMNYNVIKIMIVVAIFTNFTVVNSLSFPVPALDPKINYTANNAERKEINYALCNTFGFGGHNASIIYKKYNSF